MGEIVSAADGAPLALAGCMRLLSRSPFVVVLLAGCLGRYDPPTSAPTASGPSAPTVSSGGAGGGGSPSTGGGAPGTPTGGGSASDGGAAADAAAATSGTDGGVATPSTACAALASCCQQLPAEQAARCDQSLQGASDTVCQSILDQLQLDGLCLP